MAPILPLPQLCAAAAVLGIASHLGYFIRGEHHLEAPFLIRLSLFAPVAATIALCRFGELTIGDALISVLVADVSFFTSLWASILIYRIFFHRLNHFPGPFGAKTSKLWHVMKLAPAMQNNKLLDSLHKKYGDFVRTGKFLLRSRPTDYHLDSVDCVE